MCVAHELAVLQWCQACLRDALAVWQRGLGMSEGGLEPSRALQEVVSVIAMCMSEFSSATGHERAPIPFQWVAHTRHNLAEFATVCTLGVVEGCKGH